MRKFSAFILKWRLLIIITSFLVTGFFGYFIKNIKVENDVVKFLDQNDTEVIEFNRIGEVYGSNYMAMIIVESPNAFSYRTLSVVKSLGNKIKELDGITDVTSIVNVLDIKKVDGGIEVGDLIRDGIPTNKEELENLRHYVLSKEMYRGTIVSQNGEYLNIITKMDVHVDKQRLAHKVRTLIDSYKKQHNLKNIKFYYAGYPMIMDFMKESIFHDVKTLVPIVVALILLILLLSFGSFRGVFLPLSAVFMGIIVAIGIMALLNIPMTIVSVLLPVVLVGCGTAYGIHLLNKYNEDVEEPNVDSYAKLFKSVGVAIIMAGATTIIGFMSLATATLNLIKNFGIFSAVGIFIALLSSFFAIPAMLSYMPVRKRRFKARSLSLEPITKFLSLLVLKHPKRIVIITVVLTILSLLLYPKMKSEVNFINYFEEGSSPKIAEKIMKDHFGGSLPLSIVVKGDLKDPVLLKIMKMYSIQEEQFPHNNDPMSLASLMSEMNYVLNDSYSIPDTKDEVENLWVLVDGKTSVTQMVNNTETEGLISSRIDEQNTGTMHKVVMASKSLIMSPDFKEFVVFNKNSLKRLYKEEPMVLHILNELNIKNVVRYIDMEFNNHIKGKRLDENTKNDLVLFLKGEQSSENMLEPDFFISYLQGDEAEIILNESEQKRLNKMLIDFFGNKSLFKLRMLGIEDSKFLNYLDRELKRILGHRYQEEKEYIPDFAKTLFEMGRKEMKDRFVNNVYKVFIKDIAFKITDKSTEKKLKGLMYEATTSTIVLSKKLINNDILLKYASQVYMPQFSVNGLPLILDNMDRNLKRSQVNSLGLAIILVIILLIIQFKSFGLGLLYSVPIFIAVIINFGLMCLIGVPLDNATMMIGSIAIGIGIDYVIHFSTRFRKEQKLSNFEDALHTTMNTTGRAIIINTLTVMLGFLVLLFSGTTPMRNFGWLTSLTMVYSALGAMLFVPAVRVLIKNKK